MTRTDLRDLAVADLVERFAALGIEEGKAIDDNDRYNRLFDEMSAVQKELKSRPGDQRRALLPLFDHPDIQVRLMAAQYTLAVAPKEARRTMETIAASPCYPQAADARMSLRMLDSGRSVPD